MRASKVKVGMGVFILFFAVSGVMVYQYHNHVKKLEQQNWSLTQEVSKLQQENEESVADLTRLKSEVQKQDEQIKNLPKLEQPMLLRLQSKGFKGEPKDIVLDLMKHSELIPYEGVLGGKMGFYDENSIYVLTDQWVLASFSDGHTGGDMLLKYDWNKGEFSWKVVDSYLLSS